MLRDVASSAHLCIVATATCVECRSEYNNTGEMEDYQTAEHVKEEVVDCGFVEVDTQDVHQLCTACLCATRTTHTLTDDALKQYYMHILTEMQPEGGVIALEAPRVCWECAAHLKRSVRFREQVQDSYRLLQPMLSMCDREDLDEFLQTSVCRPGRLKTCFAHSIDISPQDDDAQVMTVTKHDDDDDGAACGSLNTNIERLSPTESFFDKNIVNCVPEDVCLCTGTEVKNDITTIKTPNSTHESTRDVNTTIVCDYCYKTFTSKAVLERHIAACNIYPHNDKTVPSPCKHSADVLCSGDQCSECPIKHKLNNKQVKQYQSNVGYDESFSIEANILTNKRKHTGEKRFQFKVCHKSFSEKGNKPYQCKVCHKSFSTKHKLKVHLIKHSDEKPYKCEVCHKSFARKDFLLHHLRTHTGEKPFQCEVCYKSFSEKSNLVRHIRSHTGKKLYQCEVCRKSFINKDSLKVHFKTHTGEKPYECEACHKKFAHKHNLIPHLRTHTGEKPFQCKACHKMFSQKIRLVLHIRTHTGEKPFQCEVCRKSFSEKGTLVKHTRTHTGKKPFQCKVCHKSFTEKGTLDKHIRIHTGEKPYQCEVCHKLFSLKQYLQSHLKIHTGVREPPAYSLFLPY